MRPFRFSRPNSQASSMASLRGKTLSLLFCLFFFSPSSVLASRSFRSDSSKVSLALYYESLCPYSANFIVSYLEKLFEDDLISIVDLKLVPWGNAKILGNDTFKCQHGPYECLLNTVEACAIHVLPKQEEHFPFIDCVESLVYQRKYAQWESCFEKLGLDPKPISDCYSSGYGKELELQYAAETNDLQPPHEYVPWVVVNGQPLFEEYQDLITYICKAYKGTKVLEACSEVFLDTVQEREANKHRNPVSYKENTMILSLSAQRVLDLL